jgi:RNA polymerase sigma factor (sigma-70 family)
MAITQGSKVLRVIRGLVRKQADDNRPDRELVKRFVEQRDQDAFGVLVRRYGSMVMGVGLRVLHNHQDAEDVCQATFLLLAKKANTTPWRDSVGNWLYEVAYRVAQDALKAARRRKLHEGNQKPLPAPDAMGDITLRELQRVLDEEMTRLPKKYRMPLILCCLEGKARDEVARCVGLPLGAVKSRLEEGRELLRRRLAGRGVQLSVALAALTLLSESARAAVPVALASATSRAAVEALAGQMTAEVVSANVLALVKGGIQTMFLSKLKLASALLVGVVALAAGTGLALPVLTAQPPRSARSEKPIAQAPPAKPRTPRAADDARVKGILESALSDAAAIKDPAYQRTTAYCEIARAQARAGQREAAATTLRIALNAESRELAQGQIISKNDRLSEIAKCQAETGDVKGAVATVTDQLDSPAHQSRTFIEIAQAQARSGDIKGALTTIDRVQDAGGDDTKDGARWRLAEIQAEAGDVKGALQTTERIGKHSAFKTLALAAIAMARAKAGDRQGAAASLQAARAAAQDGDARQLLRLAMAEAVAGHVKDARKTVEQIKSKEVRQDALWAMVMVLAAHGKVDAARDVAKSIEDDYHRGDVLKHVVVALIRANDLPGAAKEAAAIGHDVRCNALLEVAKAYARNGQKEAGQRVLDEALKLAERLEGPPNYAQGIRETALANVAGAQAACGDVEAALNLAKKHADPFVRAISQLRIADALIERGKGRVPAPPGAGAS